MQASAIPANRRQPCGDFTPTAARATICFCRRFIFRRFKSMKPAIESGIKTSCSAVYRVCRVRMAAAIRKFSEDGDSQHLRVLPVRTFPYDNASFHNTRRGPIPCTALFWYFYALFQDGGGVGGEQPTRAPAREQKKSSRPEGRLLKMVRVAGLEPTASTESSHCRGAALTLAPLCAKLRLRFAVSSTGRAHLRRSKQARSCRGATHPRACKEAKEKQPPQRTTATMVRVAGLEPTASTESSHCRGAALTLAPLCAKLRLRFAVSSTGCAHLRRSKQARAGRGATHPRACKGAKEQQPPQRTTAVSGPSGGT